MNLTDFNVVTNPYAKIYLASSTEYHGKRKTKVMRDTQSPEFNEIHYFNIEHEELIGSKFIVSVWHNDFYSHNILIGQMHINIQEFIESGFSLDYPTPQWYTLYRIMNTVPQLKFCGELLMTLEYKAPVSLVNDSKSGKRQLPNPTKGELKITVNNAKNLHTSHDEHRCEIMLVMSPKGILKMKTHLVYGDEPHWNEYFAISNISWVDLKHSYLQMTVQGGKIRKEFVGGLRLGLGDGDGSKDDSFGTEVYVWEKMLSNPNETQMFSVPLRNSLLSVKRDILVPSPRIDEITSDDYIDIKKRIDSTLDISSQKELEDAASLYNETIHSFYSDAGGISERLVITGQILLSMRYDSLSNAFMLCVERANGIAIAEEKDQNSNPYCKIYLIPDENNSTKQTTSYIRRTLNPVWNEIVTYGISREELLKKVLHASIWNRHMLGRNDFLGEVRVELAHYASTNDISVLTPVWYTLQDDDRNRKVMLLISYPFSSFYNLLSWKGWRSTIQCK